MKPAFSKLLDKYAEEDFLLQQKAKVIVSMCITILVILPVAVLYTIIATKNIAPEIIVPEITAFFIIAIALYLLLKGFFQSHPI